MAYTEGFTPRPKLSFGLALPTGAESVAEYLDIDLAPGVDIDPDDPELAGAMSAALPTGMAASVVAEREPERGSLQDEVSSTTWELTGPGIEPELLEPAAQRLLAADELFVERERKGQRRVDDVRPLILDLAPDPSGTRLVAELATLGRALRPSELAEAAFPGIEASCVRVLRTHQWIEHDGERREVLPLPAGVTALDRGLSA